MFNMLRFLDCYGQFRVYFEIVSELDNNKLDFQSFTQRCLRHLLWRVEQLSGPDSPLRSPDANYSDPLLKRENLENFKKEIIELGKRKNCRNLSPAAIAEFEPIPSLAKKRTTK
eukprot:TRINITY_DN8219_c0_g1_i1.p1 TRINITY_DN8219_c0_g1~~TRINITY_DN8219_c0_g1_i1.p1  ORF type:complete len:114 (-),score=5.59 TRINITY_DN8219_c0_g1_i1:37-378(-)